MSRVHPAGVLARAAQRIGLQRRRTALTVNATPQKSRRQNAIEFRNAQLSVVSCKPLSGERCSPRALLR